MASVIGCSSMRIEIAVGLAACRDEKEAVRGHRDHFAQFNCHQQDTSAAPRQPGEGAPLAPPPAPSGALGQAVAWRVDWAPRHTGTR